MGTDTIKTLVWGALFHENTWKSERHIGKNLGKFIIADQKDKLKLSFPGASCVEHKWGTAA